jgi:hypothetical protein
MAEGGDVLGGIPRPDAALILMERNVQDPYTMHSYLQS